ncbi:hypothetical protein JW823_04575 [bacterium]|nr:hypothetical protein [candidate division CSSED10-310 bacterium]
MSFVEKLHYDCLSVFYQHRWWSARQYCLAGFAGGLATVAFAINIMSLFHNPMNLPLQLRLFPFGIFHPGVVGVATGLDFWLAMVRTKRNRSN